MSFFFIMLSCLVHVILTVFVDHAQIFGGPVSSVDIATDYGLDCPGSHRGGDEIFRPSRPTLGPTQPPVKWVPCLSWGVKCGRSVLLTTHPSSSAAVMEE